jgi:hypothetical protein
MIGDLAPRKGHFSLSPWQRHGKTVPQKEYALKGHANMRGPSERVRHHGAPLQGLMLYNASDPRRGHGLRVACSFGAENSGY